LSGNQKRFYGGKVRARRILIVLLLCGTRVSLIADSFDSERAAVLNVGARLVIRFVKEHVVELPLIDHFPALAALIEVPFLRFAQLVKVSGIHGWDATSLAFASQGRSRCLYPFRASS
jgi:hypothetical protein